MIPSILYIGYMIDNVRLYHNPLPWNNIYFKGSVNLPRDEGAINFFTFNPLTYINVPYVSPGNMGSFWTLIYSGMWFDTEPKFLYFTDWDRQSWQQYLLWLRGDAKKYPDNGIPLSGYSRFLGSSLITLGIIPLFFFLMGLISSIWRLIRPAYIDPKEMAAEQAFLFLFIFNVFGIILLTVRFPYFSSMKASYLLNSMPAFAIFTSIGLRYLERHSLLQKFIICLFLALFLISTLHIIQIVYFEYINTITHEIIIG
jgi:hypothetical protein